MEAKPNIWKAISGFFEQESESEFESFRLILWEMIRQRTVE